MCMDFPGTINTHFEHFIDGILDITKSLAYHGFKKIILFNGHGSNWPNLDLVARRTNLETDAECVPISLVESLDRRQGIPAALAAKQVSRRLFPRVRARDVASTSIWPKTMSARTRSRAARSRSTPRGAHFSGSTCSAAGPATLISWTSSYSETGVLGDAELATVEKGRQAYEEAVTQLARFITWFKDRPKEPRRDYHRVPPTMPTPWAQTSLEKVRGSRRLRSERFVGIIDTRWDQPVESNSVPEELAE